MDIPNTPSGQQRQQGRSGGGGGAKCCQAAGLHTQEQEAHSHAAWFFAGEGLISHPSCAVGHTHACQIAAGHCAAAQQ